MIKKILLFLLLCVSISHAGSITGGQNKVVSTLPNPIMFVTQVPIPLDTSTITSVFANHQTLTKLSGRGGDLFILYPTGTLKNITQLAGFGNSGLQGASSIGVREPSMHWSGTKAVFSMVLGAPTSQTDTTHFFWQIYEVTGLGEFETPLITIVPNQPSLYNNTNPIYGTDERIIFSSDRPVNGEAHLYPQYDEYRTELANTGLWSLNPVDGNLFLLDHSPSGDFKPIIDSYGRVIFSRWDHLERDVVADRDVISGNIAGSFNYSDETASASILENDRTEYFPEPSPIRSDLLSGGNVNGFEFNHFFPWQVNEDGTGGETINHIGRHDLNLGFGKSFTDDPNLINYPVNPVRTNTNPINNIIQVVEDPATPGKYYGVDCIENGTHGAGQIITLSGAPTLNDQDMVVTYITDRATSFFLNENGTPTAGHTGHYRTPLPLSNGALLTSHTDENRIDKNTGTASNPLSRYAFRIKTMKVRTGSTLMADLPVTTGISKSISYWTENGLMSYSGNLWELDPVEVRSRTKPARRVQTIGDKENQVIAEEGIDTTVLKNYLTQRNLALMVSRNVTNRNTFDHQQPYYLKVHNSSTQSPGATGKIYDISSFQLVQAQYLRGYGLVNGNVTPKPGRRVLAVPLNDSSIHNPPNPLGPTGSVKIGSDGSLAAMIPAHRATSWRLVDSNSVPVIHERFWITFQPGEIRTCASCHGSNGDAASPVQTVPQNKPEALRALLQYLKPELVTPSAPILSFPPNQTINQPLVFPLLWNSSQLASTYDFQLALDSLFTTIVVSDSGISDTSYATPLLDTSTTYYWRVRGSDPAGKGMWSLVHSFTTQSYGSPKLLQVNADWNLISIPVVPDNPTLGVNFPTVSSFAFSFDGNYEQHDTLEQGKGYWLKFPSQHVFSLEGTVVTGDSIEVMPRWNIIGTIAYPVVAGSITSNPPGMVTSDFYGYSNTGYTIADTLKPGKGYWVKTSSAGTLFMGVSVTNSKNSQIRMSLVNEIPPNPPFGESSNLEIVNNFSLEQNYPNPFNPVTIINYAVKEKSPVSLKIYNTLGEEVALLVNEVQEQGTYSIRWDAGTMPSGVYYYKISAGTFTDMKKLLLIK